jgi:NodT family efflux transporter outer membrane factor (OMF) lipoprotein
MAWALVIMCKLPTMRLRRRPMRKLETLALLAVTLALGACSLAPAYKQPATPVAASYKEAPPWISAQPSDRMPRDHWWTVFNDNDLNQIEGQVEANNADLAAALAHYRQAKAFSDQARAGLFPTISANGNVQRDRESNNKPLRGATSPTFYDSNTLGAEVDYELDLWGRVANTAAAGHYDAQAAAADLGTARLSLQAQAADQYVQLRGLDQDAALLQQTVEAFDRALKLTQNRHGGGIASGLDVARAQTQLSSAKSQWSQTLAQRALIEHALAVLAGQSASDFSVAPKIVDIALPQVPVGVPSTLLQRRPDVAAAERRTAEANANIGVARAAYFPDITLTGLAGFQSSDHNNWISAPNSFWSLGPSFLLNIFDGGRIKAGVAAARAATDEAGATYRGVVLSAFAQVEDSLALLDHYKTAAKDEGEAVTAAKTALDFSMSRYRQGAVDYLEVTTSQTDALDAERLLLDLDTRQLRASVALIRALGGGWTTDQLADSAMKQDMKQDAK